MARGEEAKQADGDLGRVGPPLHRAPRIEENVGGGRIQDGLELRGAGLLPIQELIDDTEPCALGNVGGESEIASDVAPGGGSVVLFEGELHGMEVSRCEGRIERDGKSFEDMGAYRETENKVFGSVHLTKRNQDTFGRDLEEVISRKLTLDEAIKDGPFSIMTKQRLKVMQRDWFEQIDSLALL